MSFAPSPNPISNDAIPNDTIAAIATAAVPEQGSVGIVRMSGAEALLIAQKLFQPAGKQEWESHRVLYGTLMDGEGKALDEALAFWMQGPRSFTREDVVEFHCHGGIMAVQGALQACLGAGARLALAGEFTLRAFLNGRIDLTQAESVAQLVGAQSPQAAQVALAGVRGRLAEPIRQLRSQCIEALATIEAHIDFEDDLGPLDQGALESQLVGVRQQVDEIVATAERGALLRRGIRVAIVGQPNVGKSSLLNAWSGEDRAIVTEVPGTTRDVVESRLVVGGMPVQVLDTAGIRETSDVVESLGIERSRQVAAEADVTILVVSAALGWTAAEDEILAAVMDGVDTKSVIVAVNKTDLVSLNSVVLPEAITPFPTVGLQLLPTESAVASVRRLEDALIALVAAGEVLASGLDVAINERQKAALVGARGSLEQVLNTMGESLPLDFWTIDLRDAIAALGEITGESVTESMLERIFSQFCIGK